MANRAAVLHVAHQRSTGGTRVGFAAGRKLGKAVVRNRVKRRLREAVRLLWPRIKPGASVVIVGRYASYQMPFDELQARIAELFDRAGLLLIEGKRQ